ncbi:hypothetical protein HYZ76_00410 [Candidatus Falkowbacteria bacterium]|nr:hypothetical protein [Candidatus Falkowbacteria bacterium]
MTKPASAVYNQDQEARKCACGKKIPGNRWGKGERKCHHCGRSNFNNRYIGNGNSR